MDILLNCSPSCFAARSRAGTNKANGSDRCKTNFGHELSARFRHDTSRPKHYIVFLEIFHQKCLKQG